MAIDLNDNYNDNTTLDEYYPIIRDNLELLADEIELREIKGFNSSTSARPAETGYDVYYTGATREGVYFFDGLSIMTLVDVHAIYIGDPDGEHFGGVVNLKADEVALVRLTKANGAEVLFKAQHAGFIKDGAVGTEQLADEAVTAAKVSDEIITTDSIATVTEPGIVKLYNSGGQNRSGLTIQSDGSLMANTNSDYGTQRTGDGKITTAGATTAEIDAGANAYKPITPSTIKYAVEKYAPAAAQLTYSTTPQRIGTWTDGTPIWRWAFQVSITAEDKSEGAVYIPIPVTSTDDAFVINVFGQAGYNSPCVVDDRYCQYHSMWFDFPSNVVSGPYNILWGWYEFVTDQSNLSEL